MVLNNHSHFTPSLARVQLDDIFVHIDQQLRALYGITIAFSERTGGISSAPFTSLNLGLHVKDDHQAVLHNRAALMTALGVSADAQAQLSSAQQSHGTHAVFIDANSPSQAEPFDSTDALVTNAPDKPLLLCFADCVPVVIVSLEPRAVAVIHSGWKGTLNNITGKTVEAMVKRYGLKPENLYAYIGPFISEKNFETSPEIASQFASKFDTLSCVYDDASDPDSSEPLQGDSVIKLGKPAPITTYRVDMSCAIRESLETLGVKSCHIVSLDVCTVETTDRFFSYRAEHGITGRHGAFAVLSRD